MQLMTKQEVAAALSLSTRTVDKMDADKSAARTFPQAVRVRNRKRWIAADVQAWIIAQGKIPQAKPQ